VSIGIHNIDTPHLSKYPPAYGMHFLGKAWFYTLIVNSQQPFDLVQRELENTLSQNISGDDRTPEIIITNASDSVFSPANIFWNPHDPGIENTWLEIWHKTLNLGGSLLSAGMQPETPWSADDFQQNFETLRHAIKTELFGADAATRAAQAKPTISADDRAIAGFLVRLLEKWRSENHQQPSYLATAPIEEKPPQSKPALDELPQTVILSPPGAEQQPKPPAPALDEEETLILPSSSREAESQPQLAATDDELIQETVILSPGGLQAQADQPASTEIHTQEDLLETVIISPSDRHQATSDADFKGADQVPFSKDHTHATLKSDERRQEKVPSKDKEIHAGDDDFLPETIILGSGKQKDKGLNNE
jgi:hypothetical protein